MSNIKIAESTKVKFPEAKALKAVAAGIRIDDYGAFLVADNMENLEKYWNVISKALGKDVQMNVGAVQRIVIVSQNYID